MIRKWLFLGITLMLVVVLIYLIIQGRRLEKMQANQVVEIVQESKSTLTRAFNPLDLEIARSEMLLEESVARGTKTRTVRHEIEIRNNGKVSYSGFQLSFDYLNRGGKMLATGTRFIEQTISPGAALKLAEIKADGLPISIVNCRVAIAYADIGHTSN